MTENERAGAQNVLSLRGLRASFAARLAAARPETYIPADQLRPLYLRAPQAERAREARLREEEEKHA